jgi:hypothetical protein
MPFEVHRRPCAHCPSAHFPPDPEAEDLARAPREQQVRAAFPCGWRPRKLCRGYCDRIGLTADELAVFNEWRSDPGWEAQATQKPFPKLGRAKPEEG